MTMPAIPSSAVSPSFHTVATVVAAGDPRRCGARGSVIELRDSEVDYSTAPAHLCFWVPLSGGITVSPRKGQAYGVAGERLTISPPGSVWRGAWRGRMSTMMLEIHPAVLDELAPGRVVYPNRGELLIAEDATLRHSILALQHSLALSTPDDGLFAGHIARAVAWHYLRRYCSTRVADDDRRKLTPAQLKRALELIDARLADKLALDELAELLDLSVATFCRRFKHSVGLPPYQYVLRTRIERAKAQLARHERSLSEIAQALGFYDQSQFSNAFRRIVGISPREYRRRLQS
ncbi:helix-turn-helix domain-containing protein [Solimonas variicoloris]|uniref:helix-turn-helix domain-containing protein n=1 Tax=Solimonas variicoloris TaxID=254408 RepID=UPI000379D404|nr:AraC family transcriptional regulator [Solimonas variicoloris]